MRFKKEDLLKLLNTRKLELNPKLTELLIQIISKGENETIEYSDEFSIEDLFNLDDVLSDFDYGEWFWDNKEKLFPLLEPSLIKEEIEKCVETDDVKKLFEIHEFGLFKYLYKASQKDLIDIFDHNKLNLVQFLLDNFKEISELDYDYIHDQYEVSESLDYYLIKSKEISTCISKSIIHLLQNTDVKEYKIPLLNIGFLEFLGKEDIQNLINNPNFDFIDFIMKHSDAFISDYGASYLKDALEKSDINFFGLVKSLIKKKDSNMYFKIWYHRLWGIFNIDEIRELIVDPNLKFFENVLKTAHKVATRIIPWKKDYYNEEILPRYIIDELIDLFKVKTIEIIKKKDMDTFVPLYAGRFLSIFTDQEILTLVNNLDTNLLKLVLTALDNHRYEVLFYLEWESMNKLKDEFLKIIKYNIETSTILNILETLEDIDFSPLMEYGIIEELSFEDLAQALINQKLLRNFLKSLQISMKNGYLNKAFHNFFGSGIRFYQDLVSYLLEKILNDFKLTGIDPLDIFEYPEFMFMISLVENSYKPNIKQVLNELYKIIDFKPSKKEGK